MTSEAERALQLLGAEDAELDMNYAFAQAVEREAYNIRVRDAARRKVTAENAPEAPPFDAGTLADVLARPEEPPHRVEGLIPSQAATLIVAQRKTGKTTLSLNTAQSFITGQELLGRFATRPIAGNVAMLNFEVSAAQIARWAHEAGVDHDRLFLVNLRGRRNPFAHDDDREKLAALLREHDVESLFVDPFSRAYTGTNQNDPGEVSAWLADLDRFARAEVGAADLVLAVHAGWDGERTRGSSALEDWADSVITLVRDKDDQQKRFLRAEGRDVLVEEDELHFDARTRRLHLSGTGSRREAAKIRRLDGFLGHASEILEAEPGLSGYKLEERLRAKGLSPKNGEGSKVGQRGVELGMFDKQPGPRNSLKYYIAHPANPSTTPTTKRPPNVGGQATTPTTPIGGGGGGGGRHHHHQPPNDDVEETP